eukprot:TRINITY_DN10483_c0_g1_i1.p1 TRINITY_DN10483_c0_g1~~TRINITY_DN10483_c0_g1_i1.p1  ORF type:complete len:661 (-),score=182.25 TRINITY_DN10483_c0_g1_i1:265-2247(-)
MANFGSLGQQSVEFYEKEGPIHRSSKSPHKLITTITPGVSSVYSIFQQRLNERGDAPCLGARVKGSDGKFGEYVWRSYKQVKTDSEYFARGLRNLGLQAKDRLGIYCKNRSEWVLSYLACTSSNITIVPLYDTLGPEAVTYIINHSELTVAVCGIEGLGKMIGSSSECPTLKTIIVADEFSPTDAANAKKQGLNLITFADIVKKGSELPPLAPVTITSDDMLIIMYTSGTTGVPKGAMITNGNIISTMAAVHFSGVEFSHEDVHMSYMPMAHIFELVNISLSLYNGARIGFWRGDILGLVEDIQFLRPTLFPSVPRVLNRIYDKINATINSGSIIKKSLFQYAYQAKLNQVKTTGEYFSPLWDRLVFSKIQALLGGRVRMIISGSAPLAPAVQDFFRVCFCCRVLQGYGLTETCATLTIQDPDDIGVATVGAPVQVIEVKLVDVPEMGYTSSSNPQRGEICCRGAAVFRGYYKMPEKTAEVIDRNGWFHTGDIGEWLPNGTLRIIDRLKNIFKLAQGEYVAAEYLETVYLRSQYVMQIFVYGDSFKNYLVAVAVPDPDTVLPLAAANGIKGDINEIVNNKKLKEIIFADLNKVAKDAKLKGFEYIKNIHLESQPWTVENGLLTPTQKTKRNELPKKYKDVLTQLYAEHRMDASSHQNSKL